MWSCFFFLSTYLHAVGLQNFQHLGVLYFYPLRSFVLFLKTTTTTWVHRVRHHTEESFQQHLGFQCRPAKTELFWNQLVWQMEITGTHVPRIPDVASSASPSSPASAVFGQMSPKIKWIFSSACCSLEEPCTELWRMSEAKRALREFGDSSFALSGSVGPIMALQSSTAFSLVRRSIKQGPLANTMTGFSFIPNNFVLCTYILAWSLTWTECNNWVKFRLKMKRKCATLFSTWLV